MRLFDGRLGPLRASQFYSRSDARDKSRTTESESETPRSNERTGNKARRNRVVHCSGKRRKAMRLQKNFGRIISQASRGVRKQNAKKTRQKKAHQKQLGRGLSRAARGVHKSLTKKAAAKKSAIAAFQAARAELVALRKRARAALKVFDAKLERAWCLNEKYGDMGGESPSRNTSVSGASLARVMSDEIDGFLGVITDSISELR